MNTESTTRPTATSRPRWATLVCGLVIIWITGWYTAEGSRALLGFVTMFCFFATAADRIVLASTRAVIWTGVVLLILNLAANIERITPPEDSYTIMRLFLYDRVVTVAMVPALLALLLKPGRAAGTMIVAGCLPMLILVLAQGDERAGEGDSSNIVMWSSLVLFLLVGQVQNLARPQAREMRGFPLREFGWRTGMMALALTFTALLAAPASLVLSESAQWVSSKRLFAKLYRRHQGGFHLSLAAPPGGGSGGMTPVMSIKAAHPPGYLRQYIYRDLVRGHWAQREANSAYALLPRRVEMRDDERILSYHLPALPVHHAETALWRVQVLAPRWRFAVALPHTVEALHMTEAADVTITPDDVLNWQGAISPPVYEATIRLNRQNPLEELATPVGHAYPPRYPQIAERRKTLDHQDPGYLRVPEHLRDEIMRWRDRIEHLDPSAPPREIMQAVVNYFHQQFSYRLEGPPSGRSDDLRLFMEERQGHCTLFATASVLILRASGIPARMVGGYLSTDPHPITGEYVVRARDGHAWCEAWDAEAEGWRRLESTPSGGLPLGLAPPSRWRSWFEAAGFAWRNFVEVARQFNPIIWIAETSAALYGAVEDFFVTPIGRLTGGLLALLASGWCVFRRRKPRQHDEQARLLQELTRAMQDLECQISSGPARRDGTETWADWWKRTSPNLPTPTHDQVNDLVTDYQTLRYHPSVDPESARMWIQRANQFKNRIHRL